MRKSAVLTAVCLSIVALVLSPIAAQPNKPVGLWPNSLCSTNEEVIFSCLVRREHARATTKIASLCASRHLTRTEGYLQYRFGLPSRTELEFPSSRGNTQSQFQYTHYMRFQVDLTEINFTIDGHQYQIFDTYNGEEKPAISEEGVHVTLSGGTKEANFICRSKAKANYSMLADVLPTQE